MTLYIHKTTTLFVATLLVATLAAAPCRAAATDGVYVISADLIAPGGSMAGGDYALHASVGEPAQSTIIGADYVVQAGFWHGGVPQLIESGKSNILLLVLPVIINQARLLQLDQ